MQAAAGLLAAIVGFFPGSVAGIAQAGGDRSGFVGDAVCQPCHRERSQSYEHSPHRLTSQLPTRGTVHGSFENGANTLTIAAPEQTARPGLSFRMDDRSDGLFETARTGWGAEAAYVRAERIDVVTGSGARGQTYLYWRGDRLFELPVSYWSDGHRWINSPGYIDGTADFSRPVNPACLECHASYIRALSSDPNTNRYERQSLVPGIRCENCHGPGAEHVRQEASRQGSGMDATGSGILNPAKFSRDRQVDLCAECHNGIQRAALQPTFSYVPGRPLSEYFKHLPGSDAEHPDVHGNQVGLLQRSRCYRSSEQMSCSTCHDVHGARKPAAFYASKCLSCHEWQKCGVAAKMGHAIVDKCIECHMPIEQTNAIVSETAGQVVHATMRNHWIRVYAEARLPEKAGSR